MLLVRRLPCLTQSGPTDVCDVSEFHFIDCILLEEGDRHVCVVGRFQAKEWTTQRVVLQTQAWDFHFNLNILHCRMSFLVHRAHPPPFQL